MGEPLANYRNVVPAMRIFLDDLGYDLSRRRVTLSTSGLVPQIYKLAEECNVALAVSLHAPNDELRNELVPINRKHPIAELLAACWHYIDQQNGRSITFEYVMLDGVNDKPEHARQLARLLQAAPQSSISFPSTCFPARAIAARRPRPLLKFRDILNDHGVIATIRKTRGDDIDAACGQLAGKVTDRTLVRLGAKLGAARAPRRRFNECCIGTRRVCVACVLALMSPALLAACSHNPPAYHQPVRPTKSSPRRPPRRTCSWHSST